jgi:hypothetical protein
LKSQPRPPSGDFATAKLSIQMIDPATLIRVSRHDTGEPYFGKSGANRFDDPRKKPRGGKFGTCYFGASLHCAFAETVLHNEVADLRMGGFRIAAEELNRYVLTFSGEPLKIAVLTGIPLKNLGGDGALSTVTPYAIPQQWALAIHQHPQKVDGFLYVSRHHNKEDALVVFSRARKKIKLATAVDFGEYAGAAKVLIDFRVQPL